MSEKIIIKGRAELLKPVITQVIAIHQLLKKKDVGTIYAYSNDKESVRRKGKPKLSLYFLEDTNFDKKKKPNKISEGQRRQEGLIRFRLMNESTSTFSKSNAKALGTKIKDIFGKDKGFVWEKGKTMYSYTDWENGYQFQLLCKNETDAKTIITNVLSIQDHKPSWLYFNTIKNDQEIVKYPEEPGKQTVMGESVPIPKERPVVDVRFQYAYVKLDGVKEPINLYDRTGKRVSKLDDD